MTGGRICNQECTDITLPSWQAWMSRRHFDVAKPSVVSKILTLAGVHGHLTTALLVEMLDVWGSACFENSKTGSGTRDAFAMQVWRLLCYGVALPNTYSGMLKRNGGPTAGCYPLADNVTMSMCCVG